MTGYNFVITIRTYNPEALMFFSGSDIKVNIQYVI